MAKVKGVKKAPAQKAPVKKIQIRKLDKVETTAYCGSNA
jgi:hypothetical protein